MGLIYRVNLDGAALTARAEGAARNALQLAGEDIRQRANAIAPKRSGAMVGSSRVSVEGNRTRVSYGVAYARIQHDARGFHHPRGGQARFLAEAAQDGRSAEVLREAFINGLH